MPAAPTHARREKAALERPAAVDEQRLRPDTVVIVRERLPFDGPLILERIDGTHATVSLSLAQRLLVSTVGS